MSETTETPPTETADRSPEEGGEEILTVTDVAREKVLGIRAQEPDADQLGLRVQIVGVQGVEFQYELSFQSLAEAADDDVIAHHGDLPVVVPADSVNELRGATLDLPTGAGGGLVLRNPNRPKLFDPSEMGELEGELAEKVQTLLDGQINPAIAAHGGVAQLVAVEEGNVYLRLGGGCQGCGMASVTLTQGIETTLRDALPEVDRVIDVTDHAAGTNPYYEPAAK